jgi:hypothetical protein
MRSISALCLLALWSLPTSLQAAPGDPTVVIAEGEKFLPQGKLGWQVTHQDDSYASHTYGGMWVSQGGLLGAKADSVGDVATQTVTIPTAGKYRVWSKYQAPPYFNYLHKIEIEQGGKTVYSHVYGRKGTERLWSFSADSNELWWPWGVDHDAAEAPADMPSLAAGPAVIRLITEANAAPAGDRLIDFVVLTTKSENDYIGYKPYAVATPFANEALAATKLYLRFKNSAPKPAKLGIERAGHFQPQYGGAHLKVPETEVASGQWSSWVNVGSFCRLVHNEGLWLTLPDAAGPIEVQFARDAAGADPVGEMSIASGEAVLVPIDITWKKEARVRPSKQLALEIIAESRRWPKANGGQKPKELLYFGAFRGRPQDQAWVNAFKDALGYNTQLPKQYPNSQWHGSHNHIASIEGFENYAKLHTDLDTLRFISFGDEISLGRIDFNDPANTAKFRAWLKSKGLTIAEVGVQPGQATLAVEGDARLVWYSNLFNEEERFESFRKLTEGVKAKLGPHVLAGANYSPHHLALCYGPIFQWVDVFKAGGMSMFWAEDYIFSVPEAPQIISWMFAQMRCATKYRGQPIHMYVMPHAPGQVPGFLRRNMVSSIGFGARHIDSFWVGPEENFTENYVAWTYPETFKTIHDAIYDSAEAEPLQIGGKVRPARVAVVTGKATDFNESRLMVEKGQDPLAKLCRNAPEKLNQIICRKDQQMLYLALLHAQHAVDVITEDDIAERDELKNYDVVYFAGEWIDTRAVKKLDAWVQAGGVLYATAGIGHLNQFNQPEPGLLKLLGLQSATLKKNAVIIRTLLELPLLPAIDTITMDGEEIPAIGMRQQLVPSTAKVLGTWADGSAAVTVNEYGKGKAFAVGTLAGNSYMKSGLRVQPWPRGGKKQVYNPTDFSPAATKLVRLGVAAKKITQAARCSNPFVEAAVIDHPKGTLVTLVNWANEPVAGLEVEVRLPAAPKSARTVSGQKALDVTYANGIAKFKLDLKVADYILLFK